MSVWKSLNALWGNCCKLCTIVANTIAEDESGAIKKGSV